MAAGKRCVVDVDVEKFVDRLSHDMLMARVARKVTDKRVLRLIRRYRQAGTIDGGPGKGKYLGYSLTADKAPRLKVTPESEKQLRANLRVICKRGRGRSVRQVIEDTKRLLVGWSNCFKLAEVKDVFGGPDEWIRRRKRCVLWRQWNRPRTRTRNPIRYGLPEQRARKLAGNGRGPWWNAGAQHMNMNPRMWNRVYGGVGGREERLPPPTSFSS